MMIEEDNEQTVLQQPRRVEVWIAFNRLLNYLVFLHNNDMSACDRIFYTGYCVGDALVGWRK